jgi:hypothetical protein
MRGAWSLTLCLVLAVSVLAAALSLFPSWAAAVGLDLWNVPTAVDTLEQRAQLDERLDGEVQAALRRTAAKAEVAGEAVDGRFALFEAAARFRDLDTDATQEYRRAWLHLTEGSTDEERYCRQVLGYAALAVRGRADAADVLAGFNRQLEEALARGDLRLPD